MTQGFSEKPGISGKSDLHVLNKEKSKTPPSKIKIVPTLENSINNYVFDIKTQYKTISEKGLNKVYEDWDDYLADMYSSYPWDSTRIDVIKEILNDQDMKFIFEKINNEQNFDLKKELQTTLEYDTKELETNAV